MNWNKFHLSASLLLVLSAVFYGLIGDVNAQRGSSRFRTAPEDAAIKPVEVESLSRSTINSRPRALIRPVENTRQEPAPIGRENSQVGSPRRASLTVRTRPVESEIKDVRQESDSSPRTRGRQPQIQSRSSEVYDEPQKQSKRLGDSRPVASNEHKSTTKTFQRRTVDNLITSTTEKSATSKFTRQSRRLNNANRNTLSSVPVTTTAAPQPRKAFTQRPSVETLVSATTTSAPSTTKAPFKPSKPLNRGTGKPISKEQDDDDDGEANYPEHFKSLLRKKQEVEDAKLPRPVIKTFKKLNKITKVLRDNDTKPERSEKSLKVDIVLPEKSENLVRSEKFEKVEKIEKIEKEEKIEKPAFVKPVKPVIAYEKPIKVAKPIRNERPASVEAPVKENQPIKQEQFNKIRIPTSTQRAVRDFTKSTLVFPTRSKIFPKYSSTTPTPIEQVSTTQKPVKTFNNLRKNRPSARPTANPGNSVQTPPPFVPLRASQFNLRSLQEPSKIEQSFELNTQNQNQRNKQLGPPIKEYFPPTSSIQASTAPTRFSSRFRNSEFKAPSYLPTVPSVTQSNKVDIDLEPLPWASELVQVLTGPSVTVSIFEALSEVLTHQTTESSKLKSLRGIGTDTDSTLFPTSERTTSTSSTTTTTTTQRPPTTTPDLSDQVLEPNVPKSNEQLVNSRLVNSQVPDKIDSDPLSSTVPNYEDLVTNIVQTTEIDLSTLYLSQKILERIKAFQMRSEENLIGESFTEKGFETTTNAIEDSTMPSVDDLEFTTIKVTIPESRLGDFLTQKPIESFNTENVELLSLESSTENFSQSPIFETTTEISFMSSFENSTQMFEEIVSTDSISESSIQTLPPVTEMTESQIPLTTMSIPEMIMSRIQNQSNSSTLSSLESISNLPVTENILNSLNIASNMTVINTMTNETINETTSNISLLQNKTEASTNAPIIVDRSINNSKAIKFDDSSNKIDKSSRKNSNVPSDYVPRFSQSNRIPIAPFSATTKRPKENFEESSTEKKFILKTVSTFAQFDSPQIRMTSELNSIKLPELSSTTLQPLLETSTNKTEPQTTTELLKLTETLNTQSSSPQTTQDFSENSTKLFALTTETQTEKSTTFPPPSSSPILPSQNEILGNEKKTKKAPPIQQFRLRKPKPQERVVYGILPNNTVIRKVIIVETTTEGQDYIYGIYPNRTVVRKYRNGTIVPDQPVARIEITNIDPSSLTDPNSAIYREDAESTTQTTSVNQMDSNSSIVEFLAKYHNKTDDSNVLTPNIFSLVKGGHMQGDKKSLSSKVEPKKPLAPQPALNNGPSNIVSFRPKPMTTPAKTLDLESSFSTTSSFTTEPPNTVSMFINSFDSTESTNEPPNLIDNTVPDSSFETDFLDKILDNGPSTTDSTENFFDLLSDLPVKVSSPSTFPASLAPFKVEPTLFTPAATTQTVFTSQIPIFTTVYSSQVPMTFQLPSKAPPTTQETFTSTQNIPSTQKSTTTQPISIFSAIPTLPATTLFDFSTFAIPTYRSEAAGKVSSTQGTRATEDFYARDIKLLQELLATQAKSQNIVAAVSTNRPSTTTTTVQTTTTSKPTTLFVPELIPEMPLSTREVLTTLLSSTTTREPVTTIRMSKPKAVTTRPTKGPTRPQFSDAEDLAFLRQLANYIQGGGVQAKTTKRTTARPTTRSTTRSTTQSTTTEELTTTTSSTTQVPQTTSKQPKQSFTNEDDIAFLSSLRQYANFINLTTERSPIANQILELALNRTGKSVITTPSPRNKIVTEPAVTESPRAMVQKITDMQDDISLLTGILSANSIAGSEKPAMKLSKEEISRTKQMLQKDIQSYNDDVKLLSLLVGRPIKADDLTQLAGGVFPGNSGRNVIRATPQQITVTLPPPTTTIPPFKPMLSARENELIEAIKQIQSTRAVTTTTLSPVKSREAVLAALFKEQGIGPNNNILPVDELVEQLRSNSNPSLQQSTPATIRPFIPMPPSRPQRPILDGLSWLWRTWQDTAPGRPQKSPAIAPPPSLFGGIGNSLSFSVTRAPPVQSSGNLGYSGSSLTNNFGTSTFDDDVPVESENTPANSPPGLLNAAIGVTRAVTQFLSVALQGAARSFQNAFTGAPAAGNPNDYYAYSGR